MIIIDPYQTDNEFHKSYPSRTVERILRGFFIRSGFNETEEYFTHDNIFPFFMLVNGKNQDILRQRYNMTIFCTKTEDKILNDLYHIIHAGGFSISSDNIYNNHITLIIDPIFFSLK